MKNPIMSPIMEEDSNQSLESEFLEHNEVIRQYDKKERSKKIHICITTFFIVLFLLIVALIVYYYCFI
tara:strand:- start:521 stop:724 length:204 start_codon:yes stop_codon:yes gene_type:complete